MKKRLRSLRDSLGEFIRWEILWEWKKWLILSLATVFLFPFVYIIVVEWAKLFRLAFFHLFGVPL